jgi:hypothetical protein
VQARAETPDRRARGVVADAFGGTQVDRSLRPPRESQLESLVCYNVCDFLAPRKAADGELC